MVKIFRIGLKLLLFWFLRAFQTYVYLQLGMLLIFLFLKYVLKAQNLDTYGHDAICAAIAVYVALKTIYLVEGKGYKIFSKKFGFKIEDSKEENNDGSTRA